MRKAKAIRMQQEVNNHISYDELLENYLPKIQSAAQAIHAVHHFALAVEDFILAGIRGFKEAFMQLTHHSHDEIHAHCLNHIRLSMLRLISVDN